MKTRLSSMALALLILVSSGCRPVSVPDSTAGPPSQAQQPSNSPSAGLPSANLPSAELPSAGLPSAGPEPKADPAKSKALVGALNSFSGKLYGAVAGGHEGNLAVSPLGAFLLCEILAEGASGETKDVLDKALQRSKAGTNEVAHLVWELNQIPPVLVGQKLYINEGLKFQDGFLQRLHPVLNEPVVSLPLTDKPQESADAINRWVSLQTGGLFTRAVEPPGPNTRCIGLSTFFFQGRWYHPFDKSQTKPAKFTLADKTELQVPTMRLEDGRLDLFSVTGGKGVILPYEEGVEMVLLLPDEGQSPDGLLATVDPAVRLRDYAPEGLFVTVELPSFEFRVSGLNLGPSLTELGLGRALKGADYTAMLEGVSELDVSFQHDSYLKVDEEGTTAAAVTAATPAAAATPGPMPEIRHETIRFNRPFAFFLRDGLSGALLMMGRVTDPRTTTKSDDTP